MPSFGRFSAQHSSMNFLQVWKNGFASWPGFPPGILMESFEVADFKAWIILNLSLRTICPPWSALSKRGTWLGDRLGQLGRRQWGSSWPSTGSSARVWRHELWHCEASAQVDAYQQSSYRRIELLFWSSPDFSCCSFSSFSIFFKTLAGAKAIHSKIFLLADKLSSTQVISKLFSNSEWSAALILEVHPDHSRKHLMNDCSVDHAIIPLCGILSNRESTGNLDNKRYWPG